MVLTIVIQNVLNFVLTNKISLIKTTLKKKIIKTTYS